MYGDDTASVSAHKELTAADVRARGNWWAHDKKVVVISKNLTGEFSLLPPSINQHRKQTKKYVSSNIRNCFGTYDEIKFVFPLLQDEDNRME